MSFSEYIEDPKNKATVLSLVAGLMFGIGWWLFIDGAAIGAQQAGGATKGAAGYMWLPGVGCTLAFIMINGFEWGQLSDNAQFMYSGSGVTAKARAFLILAIIIAIGCICAAVYIMIHVYITGKPAEGIFPGIALLIQCLLIFFSAFVMRAGTMASE